MTLEERKKLFIVLLEEMLQECGGVKVKLAKKLEMANSSLTYWFQGKIDPGELGIKTFTKIADLKGISVDELAHFLGFFELKIDKSLEKFKILLEELLENTSQDELAQKTGISQASISKWLDPARKFDLESVSAMRIAAIAKQKKWSIERLLIYLDLKSKQKITSSNLKVEAEDLPLSEQVDLLVWLSTIIDRKVKESKNINQIDNKSNDNQINVIDRTVCIILETEDLEIASNYASNLAIHLNLKPENIKVTTIPKLPESIADIDILIFDISTPSSASIALIEDIEFDRDIVVFVDLDLPSEVRSSLENKVTDVIVKPIDWQKLKDKAYFS